MVTVKTSADSKERSITVSGQEVGRAQVSDDGFRYRQVRRDWGITIPFLFEYHVGNSQRPLPWYQSLSASGERIQLVRELNQQVLETDEVFLDAVGSKNQNLAALQSYYETLANSLDATKPAYEAARAERERQIQAEINATYRELTKDVTKENFHALVDAKRRAQEIAKATVDAQRSDLKTVVERYEGTSKALTAIAANIGRVNQRFTVFNMRPAAVIAAERNPAGYSGTNQQWLRNLDLTQAAMAAGAVLEPWVVALGVVDSIAKRVIKADGDTEFTYFSIPVPYDFGDERGDNAMQIVVSNNGKYEFHLNGKNIPAVSDGKLDFKSMNSQKASTEEEEPAPQPAPVSAPSEVQVSKGGGEITLTAVVPDGLKDGDELKWTVASVLAAGGAETPITPSPGTVADSAKKDSVHFSDSVSGAAISKVSVSVVLTRGGKDGSPLAKTLDVP